MSKEKRRMYIDFGIFLLSLTVILFSQVENRFFEMMLIIPIVIFINLCISVFKFRKGKQILNS